MVLRRLQRIEKWLGGGSVRCKHLVLCLINVYIVLSLAWLVFYFTIVKCGIGSSLSQVSLAKLLDDAKLYAKMLDTLLLLMKNSGVILSGITLIFLLFLSLFSHVFKSNFLSYFSMIMLIGNYIYIVVRDTTYGFYNTTYYEVMGFKIPELDVMVMIVMAPLFLLYLLNVILRRVE